MVLIYPDVVTELGLPIFDLNQPEEVDVAITFSKTKVTWKKHALVKYCKIRPFSTDSIFHSRLVHVIICPGLCMPIIFGLPFLEMNDVICDHKQHMCIVKDRKLNYNLLTPLKWQESAPPKLKLCKQLLVNKAHKKNTLRELLEIFSKKWKNQILEDIPETQPNFIVLNWRDTQRGELTQGGIRDKEKSRQSQTTL